MRCAHFRTFGFEVKPFHVELLGNKLDEEFVLHLKQSGVTRFVILDRENRLRKVVSSVLAHERNLYHLGSGGKAQRRQVHLDTECVKIDFKDLSLMGLLEDYDRQMELVRRLLKDENTIEITYEKHIERDPDVAYRTVCAFLGLVERERRVLKTKTTPFALREVVANYDEVRRYLSNSPYAWMADEK